MVAVADSSPTEADLWQPWRLFSINFNIAGLPGPVFMPYNRGGEWTIDEKRRFVRYTGPYPRSFLDRGKYVTESWSGRKVAVTYQTGRISIMRPNTNYFEEIAIPKEQSRARPQEPYLLTRLRVSLVVIGGQAFVVEDQSLKPWAALQEPGAQSIGDITSVHDAPTLQATIVIDSTGGIHVRSDDGSWTHRVGQLKGDDYGSVIDLPRANVALFMANSSVIAIRRAGQSKFTGEVLVQASSRAGSEFHHSALFETVLRYGGAGLFDSKTRWRHLRPRGWEDIPGGDIAIDKPNLFPNGRVKDLSSINKTLVFGGNQLFLYDGHAIIPVPNSGPEHLGDWPRVFDLPSIGRVFISTAGGILEITSEGQVANHRWPFHFKDEWTVNIVDWPRVGAAAVSTDDGIFVLDRNLETAQVRSSKLEPPLSFSIKPLGENPGTGDLMISGQQGMFLVIDKQHGDPDACVTAAGGN